MAYDEPEAGGADGAAERHRIVATAAGMVALFLVDLMVPLGVAVGALYVMCLTFLLPLRRPWLVYVFAGLASGLTLGALIVTLGQQPGWMVYLNRGISLVVIGVASVVLVRYKVDRRRAESRLLESSTRLRSLTIQLQNAEERERRALATYLHDEIGQPLTLLKMRLAALDRREQVAGTTAARQDLIDLLEGIVARTRKISTDLDPPVLEELGLAPAIEWMARELCTEHGLALDFDHQEAGDSVGRSASLLLYRGARELLTNTVKHAAASFVEVRVALLDGRVRVRVTDDGRGFDATSLSPGNAEGGYGLYSLRERLHLLGGRLDIVSEPDGGTSAEMVLPYQGEMRAEVDEPFAACS